MTETANFWAVYERLYEAEGLPLRVPALVEAAMRGDAALDEALVADEVDAPAPRERPEQAGRAAPRAFLSRIDVAGFRGIGAASRLALEPGPGLTLVVGRNGSGKSSFVEGLELLLTGDSTRWTGKKPVRDWRSGWRNLHTPDRVHLEAQFTVEGTGQPVRVGRRWAEGAKLDDHTLAVRRGTELVEGGLDGLGWARAVQESRPFLSYNDISRAWDAGPSKLFDTLMGMLGMEDVRDALGRLADRRKALDKRRKACSQQAKSLVAELARSSDPRAAACREALDRRTPDLEALEAALGEEEAAEGEGTLARLRRLASLRLPDEARVIDAIEALDQAVAAREAAAGSSAAHALKTADLLEHALRWHADTEIAVCPVCGTEDRLDAAWREQAGAQAAALKQAARAEEGARRAVQAAERQARALLGAVQAPDGDEEVLQAARRAVADWSEAPSEPAALARHLERAWTPLQAAVHAVREHATGHLEALHADWRPLRHKLESWRSERAEIDASSPDLRTLKAAEAWLKQADEALRAEAFAPIAEHAKRCWAELRAQSNVDIADVTLAGSTTNRKVQLDVTVDGTQGVAMGVMSQGELHAMALSLFLPRLLRADSPFGFLLIDDPVQAMDPAKVDGLARVLRDAAATHQVVVFTHDPRLPAAVRRLGIGATVLEVARNPTSHVDVRISQDPVQQHISDAFHLSDQRDSLGDSVVRHVVPGLCRAAVEAALTRRVWREQLARGEAHADIAERIAQAHNTQNLAALAFFGDANRGGEVYARLKRLPGDPVGVFKLVKDHAHKPLPSELGVRDFIVDARRLAEGVLA